jgi:hypothetical protein
MLALATAAHAGLGSVGSLGSGETLTIVGAIAAALFWRMLVKIGLAVLVIGFLILLFEGASAIQHVLHMMVP